MKTRPALALLCAAVLSVFGTAVLAQTTSGSTSINTESTRLANRYSTFAGSDANSMALVDGLRNGTSITLETTSIVKNTDGTTSTVNTPTTFQPATGKLGYGNVNIALALAEADLNKLGITDPTSTQIAAALNGGSVILADGSTENLQGVLALRAQGEGWGQISQQLGTGKLGAVVSAAENSHSQAGVAQANRSDHHGQPMDMPRPPHPVHPDHPTVPQHPSVPSRPDIPSHAGRPGGG
ncbi:MAG: hypothetical protein EPN38_10470 [Rhodanobacteraceae bacterium]|nr:MAG: hypothetical protein EPN38_10470 [Rhodanobacteraceae bacterium]